MSQKLRPDGTKVLVLDADHGRGSVFDKACLDGLCDALWGDPDEVARPSPVIVGGRAVGLLSEGKAESFGDACRKLALEHYIQKGLRLSPHTLANAHMTALMHVKAGKSAKTEAQNLEWLRYNGLIAVDVQGRWKTTEAGESCLARFASRA